MKTHQLAVLEAANCRNLCALLWLVSSISGQTLVDVRTQTKNVDFSGAASTIPARSGSALPSSCKLGEMFFNTTNTPGQNLYTCAPANTWTELGNSGSPGSGLTAPSTTTVGNVPQFSNAVGTGLSGGLSVVTSLGTPGSDSSIPTEKSIRSAISTAGTVFTNLTGGTNTSASLLIGSGASLAATGTGAISATSVPASGVLGLAPSATTDTTNANNIASGTLPAARLPNPTLATLGGVQSASPVAHQWVNGISSSGAPLTSQPTFADVASGTNGSATLVLGSGSSLSATSGGIIAATTSQVLQASQHVAEGDSITAGYLVAGSAAYPTLLAIDENASLVDRAVSGQQACDLANTQTVKYDLSTIDKNSAVYTMMIGTNDANIKGTGPYESIFQGCHKAAIAWNAVGDKVAANSANCTDGGTWGAFTGYALVGEFSTTNGSTKTCSLNTFGGPLYAWYYQQDGNGGAFTYSVDGGAPVALTTATLTAIATHNNGTYGWGLIRVTGLAAGSHTIQFVVTSATNSNNGVAVSAIGTPPPAGTYGFPRVYVGGIPRQQGDANSAVTAQYNADVLADVNLLAGDGLGVYFVNIRNYLCASVVAGVCVNSYGAGDMQPLGTPNDGGLHPNAVGHNDLKQAFENTEQFVPYASGSGGGSGTVGSGTAGQFATYSSGGTAVSGHTLVVSDIPALSYDAAGAAATVQTASLQKSNNLSDLASAATARTNLGITFTGTGSQTVTGTGAGVSGNCVRWDANGNAVDAGAPCGSGSGSSSSAWSLITPGTNTSGAFVLGTGASLATSGTGTIAATAVPASGVSGTLAAGNLPNPTAATLGGVQSIAAGTHQWINTISTSGVPSLTQPAFTDVSGTATDSQLPTDQCTLTKYTITGSQLTAAASFTPGVTLLTLPSTSTRICLLEISGTTSFTGAGITAATVRMQSGAATPLLYSPNQDIFGTVGPTTNNFWSDAGNIADRTNQSVVAAFTFTGATSATVSTAASVTITIGIRTMP